MSTDNSPINLPHEENQEKAANSSDSLADSIADSEETIVSCPVPRCMIKPRHNDDGACSNPKPSSNSEPKSSAPALGFARSLIIMEVKFRDPIAQTRRRQQHSTCTVKIIPRVNPQIPRLSLP
ncbi:hypothetical protein ACFE04_031098 [Oxalis oulophora]